MVGSGALGFSAFKNALTPYVSFREAKAAGRTVQVSGVVNRAQVTFDPRSGTLKFPLKDHEGEIMNVIFEGGKPNNFDQAEQIVAIGRSEGDTFRADSLLTKCPSKYEEEPGRKKAPETDSAPMMKPASFGAPRTTAPTGGPQ